ncbi:MAG: Holliday junction branch migration protein RuvA [Flavobacteriaceae bacterium]|nr:Holliday junction branch migration protein RuvA [Flavobacteriaceae bacterium]
MITFLRGRLIEKNPTHVIVECNGVGYHVDISLHTYGLIPDQESVQVHTYLQIKEDSHTLYGFFDTSEREIFKLLISVNGIGASTARTMLSSLNPDEIGTAIAQEDVKKIQSVKGIGLKTAQRVIIDLKDKISKVELTENFVGIGAALQQKDEAISALEVLGYHKKSSEKIIDALLKIDADMSVEQLIKQALNRL